MTQPDHTPLHPADATDDPTGNTRDAAADPAPDGDPEDAPWPGDGVPGDGTVDGPAPAGSDPGGGTVDGPPPSDALRAVARDGREAEAARADMSGSAPTPTETLTESTAG